MKEARIEDNGTVSTGVTTASDYLNTTRSKGDITTVFICTDNAGNVTTEKVSYAVVWCCGCCYTNKKYPRYDGSMTNNICSSTERVCNNHAKYTNCTYDSGYVTYREWSYTSC